MNDRSKTGERASRARKASAARQKPVKVESAQQAVGNFLRATREAQKLTQEQVASMTKALPWKLSRAAISAIERGQNFPGMEAMLALSNVLHVDPKELVERAQLSTAVPVDVTELGYDDLARQASESFWAGDFRRALAIYDAMLEKVALDTDADPEEARERTARLEVRRATALKRSGALLSAIASAERAISISPGFPAIQADAYVVLSDLQCQRGHLPLARDAARRATDLADGQEPRTRGWAWMAVARVHYLAEEYEPARKAYLEARDCMREANDELHLTHIEGNVGMCWQGQGQRAEARKWLRRAVERAREQGQPALEASWLVELGKVALDADKTDEAESLAVAALRIAKPLDNHLTVFRAEWLQHRIGERARPGRPDRHRLHFLRKLFHQLDQHEGIEEVREFRETALRSLDEDRHAP